MSHRQRQALMYGQLIAKAVDQRDQWQFCLCTLYRDGDACAFCRRSKAAMRDYAMTAVSILRYFDL